MLKGKHICLLLAALMINFTVGCVPSNFVFQKEIGKSGSEQLEFLSPTDMDTDKSGNIVVSDSGNNRFQVISTIERKVINTGGELGVGGFKLQRMSGIGVDKKNDFVWVCDQKENKIVKFDISGLPISKITDNMKSPMDVAIDSYGDLYVIMARGSEIYKFSEKGKFLGKIGGKGKSAFIFPISIIINKDIIYVADFGGKRIVKMKLDGTFIEEIKKKGEYEDMKGPSNLCIDNEGNMYILDLGEVPVFVLDPKGNFISQIGAFGNREGCFLYPLGVVAKSSSDIYILDNSRNTILNFVKQAN